MNKFSDKPNISESCENASLFHWHDRLIYRCESFANSANHYIKRNNFHYPTGISIPFIIFYSIPFIIFILIFLIFLIRQAYLYHPCWVGNRWEITFCTFFGFFMFNLSQDPDREWFLKIKQSQKE